MVRKFFEKHIDSLKEKDALKMIHKKAERAEDLCEDGDPSYLKELAMAAEMIEDYFQVKGLDYRQHLR